MVTTIDWPGKSGKKYTYGIYGIDTNFEDEDGNYIFCRNDGRHWLAIYVGEGNLKERTANHHQADCISQKGATYIHAHTNPNERARKAEEADVLGGNTEAYAPTGCNERRGG